MKVTITIEEDFKGLLSKIQLPNIGVEQSPGTQTRSYEYPAASSSPTSPKTISGPQSSVPAPQPMASPYPWPIPLAISLPVPVPRAVKESPPISSQLSIQNPPPIHSITRVVINPEGQQPMQTLHQTQPLAPSTPENNAASIDSKQSTRSKEKRITKSSQHISEQDE